MGVMRREPRETGGGDGVGSAPPKTYKRIGGFVAKELSNAYNSGCVSIYEAKDKTLRYSVYRDGCFYPYYGKLEVAE